MRKILILSTLVLLLMSCGRRNVPSGSSRIVYKADPTHNRNEVKNTEKTSSIVLKDVPEEPAAEATKERKPAPEVKRAKASFPKTIIVNDAAASKSIDGRLYYDVEGHRYWKNFKDGKYYLFDKSMYNNPDFTPPSK